jgi:PIN domain nuclease of toxin-antitoxin system
LIVLDTHAWLWWVANRRDLLSAAAADAIAGASEIGIPTMCCYEVAMLDRRQRIGLDRDIRAWITQALSGDRVRELPITAGIAVAASRLLWDHDDPLDRLIVATAVVHRAPLVTKDDRIRRFQGVPTIW